MKLRQLQCLCAVVDAGFNISRAATLLHATQPAVGKQLRQFEQALGVDLLHRLHGRPVGLTDAGERVLGWARKALQCTDNIRTVALDSTDAAAVSVSLATSHTHANYVLPPALRAFTAQHPRARIRLLQGVPSEVAELVRKGTVDIGVTHQPRETSSDLVAIPFLSVRQVLALPTGHPLLRVRTLTLEKLAAWPIIAQDPSRPQGSRVLRRFQQAGLEVQASVQALDADVMKTYVAAGLGIAIIPAFSWSSRRDPGLRIREVDHLFEPAVSVVLLRRNSQLSLPAHDFLEALSPALERQQVQTLVFGGAA